MPPNVIASLVFNYTFICQACGHLQPAYRGGGRACDHLQAAGRGRGGACGHLQLQLASRQGRDRS